MCPADLPPPTEIKADPWSAPQWATYQLTSQDIVDTLDNPKQLTVELWKDFQLTEGNRIAVLIDGKTYVLGIEKDTRLFYTIVDGQRIEYTLAIKDYPKHMEITKIAQPKLKKLINTWVTIRWISSITMYEKDWILMYILKNSITKLEEIHFFAIPTNLIIQMVTTAIQPTGYSFHADEYPDFVEYNSSLPVWQRIPWINNKKICFVIHGAATKEKSIE